MPEYIADPSVTDLFNHRKTGGKFVCGGELVTLIPIPNMSCIQQDFPFLGFVPGDAQVKQWRYDGHPPAWDDHARLYPAKEVLSPQETITQLTLQRDEAKEEARRYRYALSQILHLLRESTFIAFSNVQDLFEAYTDLLDE